MCLGIPGRILAVEGEIATADFFGTRRRIRLDVVDEPVEPGDYVVSHVGFAVRRIPPDEIAEILPLYERLLAEAAREDPWPAPDGES